MAALRQALVMSLIVWAVTGGVSVGWWLLTDEPYKRSLALSCIIVGLIFLLGGGSVLARINIVGATRGVPAGPGSWAVGPNRYGREYEDEAPGRSHITWLGSALIVAPQLIAVALLLLE